MSGINLADLAARVNALPTPARAGVDWFIDIDGVLNVIGRHSPQGGWGHYERTTATNEFSTQAWPICYSPTLMRLLSLLHHKGVVTFRWLTTWEHEAPTQFAPAVGLDLGCWIAGEDLGTSITWWKLDVIVDHLAEGGGGLTIWTDDDIKHSHHALRVVDFLHPEQALVVCPDQAKGLTPENFDLILSAIEKAVAS